MALFEQASVLIYFRQLLMLKATERVPQNLCIFAKTILSPTDWKPYFCDLFAVSVRVAQLLAATRFGTCDDQRSKEKKGYYDNGKTIK
jgi:hypothetical protein